LGGGPRFGGGSDQGGGLRDIFQPQQLLLETESLGVPSSLTGARGGAAIPRRRGWSGGGLIPVEPSSPHPDNGVVEATGAMASAFAGGAIDGQHQQRMTARNV